MNNAIRAARRAFLRTFVTAIVMAVWVSVAAAKPKVVVECEVMDSDFKDVLTATSRLTEVQDLVARRFADECEPLFRFVEFKSAAAGRQENDPAARLLVRLEGRKALALTDYRAVFFGKLPGKPLFRLSQFHPVTLYNTQTAPQADQVDLWAAALATLVETKVQKDVGDHHLFGEVLQHVPIPAEVSCLAPQRQLLLRLPPEELGAKDEESKLKVMVKGVANWSYVTLKKTGLQPPDPPTNAGGGVRGEPTAWDYPEPFVNGWHPKLPELIGVKVLADVFFVNYVPDPYEGATPDGNLSTPLAGGQ
jgi:hypothetical protein